MTKRRLLGAVAIVALLGGGISYANRDALQMQLFALAVDRATSRDVMATLDQSALHVAFCGTGSPLPNRERAGACTAVIAGGRVFVFDVGDGAGETLGLMGIPLDKIEGVWLTHLHSDHFEGLGPLALQRWPGTSASTPLSVAGPDGVGEIADGLTRAYRIDSTYRIAHHGKTVVPPSGFGLTAQLIAPGIVFDQGGVRITAFPVNHAPVSPAFGYRLDWQGQSVTISGDTAAASPTLQAAAKGTDLLVHEVLSARMIKVMQGSMERARQLNRAKIMADIPGYHATPEMAGDVAKTAGAKALALTHIVPSTPRFLDGLFLRPARDRYAGPVWMMKDGDLISLDRGKADRRNLLD